MRAGADDAHLARQHVEQLRQLVEAGPAKEAADAGHAVVVAARRAAPRLVGKLDSKGPVFFRQVRLGEAMREFTVIKFRTMRVETTEDDHRRYVATIARAGTAPSDEGLFKLKQQDAVTRLGSWLRRTSLDELPQLLNVLRGEMSLVGPRPCLAYELEHFAPHHFERFLVPAGLTGLWQVRARARSTFGEALDLDVLYAQSHSLGLDLGLILRTPLLLLRRQGTA